MSSNIKVQRICQHCGNYHEDFSKIEGAIKDLIGKGTQITDVQHDI